MYIYLRICIYIISTYIYIISIYVYTDLRLLENSHIMPAGDFLYLKKKGLPPCKVTEFLYV